MVKEQLEFNGGLKELLEKEGDRLLKERAHEVRKVNDAGKMVATICHGPWILISAGIVRGRRMTSTVGIRDDVENAGARWVDEPAVIDGNLVSARVPKDLPAFGKAMLRVLQAAEK